MPLESSLDGYLLFNECSLPGSWKYVIAIGIFSPHATGTANHQLFLFIRACKDNETIIKPHENKKQTMKIIFTRASSRANHECSFV